MQRYFWQQCVIFFFRWNFFGLTVTKWPEKCKIHKLKFNFVVQHRITLSSYHLSKRLNDFKLRQHLICGTRFMMRPFPRRTRAEMLKIQLWIDQTSILNHFFFSSGQLNAWPISLYLHFDRVRPIPDICTVRTSAMHSHGPKKKADINTD